MKAQLRGNLYENLKIKNDKVDLNLRSEENRVIYKFAVSIISDFMKKLNLPYALSVFLPECGVSQEILSKKEILDLLRVPLDEPLAQKPDSQPLIMDILEILKS